MAALGAAQNLHPNPRREDGRAPMFTVRRETMAITLHPAAERLRQTPTDALIMAHAELAVYSGFLCALDIVRDNPVMSRSLQHPRCPLVETGALALRPP